MQTYEIVIIGGGSAGMSAALEAKKAGCHSILIIERTEELGGILQQCIHNGFGLQLFNVELSGPAFAQRLIDEIQKQEIAYKLQTTVVEISKQRDITYVNPQEGYIQIHADAIILASGCYERTSGAIQLPGKRLKGIYTAGTAQRYLNIENIRVGKNVFILGSGDIGLIMARRMRLEGANVIGVAELMPYSNGLTRNLVQCLDDFDIPLYLSHTIIDCKGSDQLTSITLAQVDEHLQPILSSAKEITVDTLLLSVGLLPEITLLEDLDIEIDAKSKGVLVNERMETSISHIYACGNGLHVHDIVDYVAMEAQLAGSCAVEDLLYSQSLDTIPCIPEDDVSYILPQRLHTELTCAQVIFSLRVKQVRKHVEIVFYDGETCIKKVRKQVVLPAEMLRIPITSNLLVNRKEIRVKVREVK